MDGFRKIALDFVEVQDFLIDKSPAQFRRMILDLEKEIRDHNFIQKDRRYSRRVYAIPGHFLVIKDPLVMSYLRRRGILRKYTDDWNRMTSSFLSAIHEAKRDLDSRQIVVFNNADFKEVKQCFTQFQFVYTARKEFDLYVYQRSGDLDKLKDDLTFFAHIAEAFEIEVRKKVTKIVVIYGNIHFTKE